MSPEPEAYFLPNAAVASLISRCAIDASDPDSLFRKFPALQTDAMDSHDLEELGLTVEGEVPTALRTALELLAAADRIVTLSYREPEDGLAASILAGAADQLVPVGVSAEGIFAGTPISVDAAVDQLLSEHLSSSDRAVIDRAVVSEGFECGSSAFQVASAMRVAAGGPLMSDTLVQASRVEEELKNAYAHVVEGDAAELATASISKAIESGLLRQYGADLLVTDQLASDFHGVFRGSTLAVVSKRLQMVPEVATFSTDVEVLSGQLSVLFGPEGPFRVLFDEEITRFVPCAADDLGVLLAIALSETCLPASIPLERRQAQAKSGEPRQIHRSIFLDRFQLAASAAQAPTASDGSIPALLYLPSRTMTIEVHRAEDPIRVFLNADEDEAVSWSPFADGVVVTELSSDDGPKLLEELINSLEDKCGAQRESSEFWLNPSEIVEDEAGVTVKAGPLSETDEGDVVRFDFTCTALQADGMIRGESFTGLAADGAGIWVLDRVEADSMLFVPADCDTLRSDLIRGWNAQN